MCCACFCSRLASAFVARRVFLERQKQKTSALRRLVDLQMQIQYVTNLLYMLAKGRLAAFCDVNAEHTYALPLRLRIIYRI